MDNDTFEGIAVWVCMMVSAIWVSYAIGACYHAIAQRNDNRMISCLAANQMTWHDCYQLIINGK